MKVVRVLALLCVFVFTTNYLDVRGIEGNNLSFSLKGAIGNTYKKFINELRVQLTDGTQSSNGIPVLHQRVADSRRFILVDLSNYDDLKITVAIDVVTVYVVAYRVGIRSYFLRQDDPNVPLETLFCDTMRQTLQFTGSYIDLQKVANRDRKDIPLGPSPLDNAISGLGNQASVAESFLIIFQMVSEAARFRYIETQVRISIDKGDSFKPNSATLSLENNWSSLSTEIQRALPGGLFTRTVELRSISNNPVLVDNIASPFIVGVALLLYRCSTVRSNALVTTQLEGIIIRMHVMDDVIDNMCLVQNRTTRISGRDGLCVDVKGESDNDGTPIQVWPCGQQRNQKWTFQTDGTIRSMGKCMTTTGYSSGAYVVIYECGSVVPEATKWALSTDGTITNPRSGLVLTASAGQGTQLTVKTNTYNPSQGWRAGDDVDPTVCFITGYKDLCMQANTANNRVRMEKCVLGNQQQRWALYGDGTIRVNSDRSLCMTSNGHSSMDFIIILKCQGRGDQRWVFRTDGSILNPNAKLVMEVRQSNVSVYYQIVLYQPTRQPNQEWLPYF